MDRHRLQMKKVRNGLLHFTGRSYSCIQNICTMHVMLFHMVCFIISRNCLIYVYMLSQLLGSVLFFACWISVVANMAIGVVLCTKLKILYVICCW